MDTMPYCFVLEQLRHSNNAHERCPTVFTVDFEHVWSHQTTGTSCLLSNIVSMIKIKKNKSECVICRSQFPWNLAKSTFRSMRFSFCFSSICKNTAQKRKFFTKDFFRKRGKFVIFHGFFTFTKETLNRKHRFLCSENVIAG